MLFNSYIFILAFLPVTLAGYFGLARLFRKLPLNKIWLVGCSLVFYAYFNVRYLPIIVLSILVNYALSQGMLAARGKGVRALLLAVGLLGNLGVLGYYKYYDFFVQNVNALAGTSFVLHSLVLPLGISFFTFQQLSYVIDSYRRTVPRYGLIDYSLFVTFFPQLIAGPIVLHSEIVPQFANPENRRNLRAGVVCVCAGAFQKGHRRRYVRQGGGVGLWPGAGAQHAGGLVRGICVRLSAVLRLFRLLRHGHGPGAHV